MPSKFRIYPYGLSNTAHDLVEALDGLLIKRDRSRYLHNPAHVVINWGSATRPPVLPATTKVLNNFDSVRIAISKIRTYDELRRKGVKIPDVTLDQQVAQQWLSNGLRVVGRDVDSGHSGVGIRIYHPRRDREVAVHRFYTKYWIKNREFRIHVLNGTVIFQQEKVRHINAPNADRYIRSHNRGWGFAFNQLETNPVPEVVGSLGKQSIEALDLDFGGVDIGWNQRDGGCVFEVNTAPGLENSSLKAYADAFGKLE